MKDFVQKRKLSFMGHKDGLQSMASVVFTALFCILCGIVLFVWPDMSARIVCMVLGAILVLVGVIYLVSFFSTPPGTFICGYRCLDFTEAGFCYQPDSGDYGDHPHPSRAL